ncbi:DapH/DapD/GlmU-related protein [Achromobacter sp. F4_2707]|uniref:acyltransferase n=1 Tax=Achromobacter sp. F4_2707 TaxID=3114286 RepID=UPI0039C755DA
MIIIHDTARISPLSDIEDSVRGTRISIGAGSIIDSFVKIKPAGGMGDIEIGKDCVINSGCVLYTGNGIIIGNRVAIAANCTLAPTNHEFRDPHRPIREQGFRPSKGGIQIHDDVWIGANCVLLDGAILEKGCVIGAGSIVRGRIPEYAIYAGNPITRIGSRGHSDLLP